MATRLGPYVRERRLALGWTLEELATRSGLPLRRVHSIEVEDSCHPRRESLEGLADALDEDLAVLILMAYAPRQKAHNGQPMGGQHGAL